MSVLNEPSSELTSSRPKTRNAPTLKAPGQEKMTTQVFRWKASHSIYGHLLSRRRGNELFGNDQKRRVSHRARRERCPILPSRNREHRHGGKMKEIGHARPCLRRPLL